MSRTGIFATRNHSDVENSDHIAADVGSDEQLGHLLCQNGFVEGADELPEKVYELLNFQKIGKDFRMAEHGSYADGCYVAPDGDIPHREIPYGISPPEYLVMLDVVNKGDASKRWPLGLPSVPAEMDSVLKRAGAENWSYAGCWPGTGSKPGPAAR